MRFWLKSLLALGLVLLAPAANAANSTVSAMSAAGAFTGTELMYIVQGGADKKGTPAQMSTYVYGLMTGDCTVTANAITCTKTNGTAFGTLATATPGTGVATAIGNNLSSAGGLTTTIASGTSALGTGAITSATCATVVTTAATGTATTDVLTASFNGDPTAVTGYIPSTSGMLTIIAYPTLNNVNFKVCNNTSGSITPGAITLNWRVVR